MKRYADENYVDEVFQKVYPVGSIYMSMTDTNPAELFGFGEWMQINDVFLIGASGSYPAGTTGGEFEHKLTVDEMPSHQHDIRNQGGLGTNGLCASKDGATGTDGNNWCFWDKPTDMTNNASGDFMTTFVGGSVAHNNTPPIWLCTCGGEQINGGGVI